MLDEIANAIFCFGLGICLTQLFVVFWRLWRTANSPVPLRCYPSVAILKPLKGLDDQLEANLRSFFELDYPHYEILFAISETDDQAVRVVHDLQKQYPHIITRLVICTQRIGLNPKINALNSLMPHLKSEYLLISDSNIRVEPMYLTRLLAYLMEGDYGLVTSCIRGCRARKLGSIFENLHLNSVILASVLASEKLFRKPISIGKSMLFKRETLQQIGGFKPFRNYLAEDYFIGEAIRKNGLKISTAPVFVDNINENWDVQRFFNRHTRWAKIRFHTYAFTCTAEFISNPVFNAMLLFFLRPDSASATKFVVVMLLKTFLDGCIIRLSKAGVRWHHLLLIPLKDLCIGLIWFLPFVSRKIVWRGNHLKIYKNTKLIPLTQGG